MAYSTLQSSKMSTENSFKCASDFSVREIPIKGLRINIYIFIYIYIAFDGVRNSTRHARKQRSARKKYCFPGNRADGPANPRDPRPDTHTHEKRTRLRFQQKNKNNYNEKIKEMLKNKRQNDKLLGGK